MVFGCLFLKVGKLSAILSKLSDDLLFEKNFETCLLCLFRLVDVSWVLDLVSKSKQISNKFCTFYIALLISDLFVFGRQSQMQIFHILFSSDRNIGPGLFALLIKQCIIWWIKDFINRETINSFLFPMYRIRNVLISNIVFKVLW